MSSRIPLTVIHYSRRAPGLAPGGVQRFARVLELMFERVEYLTPRSSRERRNALERRIPVICDNQLVLDWPDGFPVIGFQHGVGAVKFQTTRSLAHWRLRRMQQRAARRPCTLWVACAEWVASTFERLYGNGAKHIIYYTVDTDLFDGRLDNAGSRLILHDARNRYKGRSLIPHLAAAFPDWRFEPLACPPESVPDRLRRARAFIHLSRYEGNSLVCNEAMAMNLPCLFTRVGLLNDANGPTEVTVIDAEAAYGNPGSLISVVDSFLRSLDSQARNPRAWILAHATPAVSIEGWRRVMMDFQKMSGWSLGART
jgi:glycosyltransferase involved in cell wall biosynthesis